MKTILNKIENFILDYIWQFPQNLIGKYYLRNNVDIITQIDNNKSKYNVYLTRSTYNIVLGKYIFIYQKYKPLNIMINHLIGHAILSRKMGIFYMPLIYIPSLIWITICKFLKSKGKNINFYTFYTEFLADFEYVNSKE